MSGESGTSNGTPCRTPPSKEEQARRRKAIETARRSNQLSGFEPDPEVETLCARYVVGELTRDELTAAIITLARPSDHSGSTG